ncbi:hypothetical protein QBC47DRAFT_435380 [Echria macrotheca]|uniref:DUF7580 domain-containing protein n=1 Tax=Echria macrotheca TaxID=438768 RepID=A0AAJ0B4Y7_9PEZI|nr:hypothetical protein QBC47DRAFT_435380 [Echria macrotheca]
MSGFEVAGVVLGALPLVVKAVEAYITFIRDWGKIPSELKSIHRHLTTERSKFYNVCDQLLCDVVQQKDIEAMLKDPFGPLWQAEDTNKRIRRRLWNSYEPFSATVREIHDALNTIQIKLNIHISDDGRVKWVDKSHMSREFRKFLCRLDRKDYLDALALISTGVDNLESLARLSVQLEPKRRTRSAVRVINILRNLSSSLYRAFRCSMLCNDQHDITLGLSPRLIDICYDDGDEKILEGTKFIMAISFDSARDVNLPESTKSWKELEIRANMAPTATASPSVSPPTGCSNVKTEPKKAKSVTFFMPWKSQEPDVKSVVASITRQVGINVAFEVADLRPLNLCATLMAPCSSLSVCYGHMIDSECSSHFFKVFHRAASSQPRSRWSIITLREVLDHEPGLQPLLFLEEKIRLALAISSSVLQLSKTPWLPGPLRKEDVHFFDRDGQVLYSHPFLSASQATSPTPQAQDNQASAAERFALFSLGILLLEIILGCALDKFLEPGEDRLTIEGENAKMIRDSIAAHRLLRTRVALISPGYKVVVERCLACAPTQGFEEESFRENVYKGVVAELETILEHTKLS